MVTSLNPNNGYVATQAFNQLVPAEGPKFVTQIVPFLSSGPGAYGIDFTQMVKQGFIALIQSVWVDNTGNASELTISPENTAFVLRVPAATQGWFAVPGVQNPKFIVYSAGTDADVPLMFFNVPVPPQFWPQGSGTGPIEVTGTVDIANQPIAVETQASLQTVVNAQATTIATGGVSQACFLAGGQQNGVITNPASATESLFVAVGTAATTTAAGRTFELQPGQSFSFGAVNAAVNVNAATTGHVFSAQGNIG
jgi:hypothetical protein